MNVQSVVECLYPEDGPTFEAWESPPYAHLRTPRVLCIVTEDTVLCGGDVDLSGDRSHVVEALPTCPRCIAIQILRRDYDPR